MPKRTPNTPTTQAHDAATARPAVKTRPRKRGATAPPAGAESITGFENPVAATEGFATTASTVATAADAGELPQENPGDAPMYQQGSSSMGSSPTEDDIRMRAYQLYLERGGAEGNDFEDWLRAERELRQNGH